MNVLFKKYSTMTQEKVFSNTFGATALAIYDEFESAEALANMDLHELTDFIIKKGKNRFYKFVMWKEGQGNKERSGERRNNEESDVRRCATLAQRTL